MAGTADDLLRAIDAIYRRWLTGELSQEDALFEIGDLLDDPLPDADEGGSGPGPCGENH